MAHTERACETRCTSMVRRAHHARAVLVDVGRAHVRRTMHVDAGCVDARERASELASWRRVASVGLKTGGCTGTSAERDLRKRGAGEALDAGQPARWQGRDGGQEKARHQHRHLAHSLRTSLWASHVPRRPRRPTAPSPKFGRPVPHHRLQTV